MASQGDAASGWVDASDEFEQAMLETTQRQSTRETPIYKPENSSRVVHVDPDVGVEAQPGKRKPLMGRLLILEQDANIFITWSPDDVKQQKYAIVHPFVSTLDFRSEGTRLFITTVDGTNLIPFVFASNMALRTMLDHLPRENLHSREQDRPKGGALARALQGLGLTEDSWLVLDHFASLGQMTRSMLSSHSDESEAAPSVTEMTRLSLSRAQRTAPVSTEDWTKLCDAGDHGATMDTLFHGGACKAIRREVWHFLLGYDIAKAAELAEEYQTMQLQWTTITPRQLEQNAVWRDTICRVRKDVDRTDRDHSFFAGDENENLEALNRILCTYCVYNTDLGYVQGMSDLVSVILQVTRDEVEAFWCFVGLMERAKGNFSEDQQPMAKQLHTLQQLVALLDPELMDQLKANDSDNLYFCFRWLLIWFKREFDFDSVCRIWEAILACPWSEHYQIFVCAAMLCVKREEILRDNLGFDDLIKFVNDLAGNVDGELVLSMAETLLYQLRSYTHPPADLRELLIGASSP